MSIAFIVFLFVIIFGFLICIPIPIVFMIATAIYLIITGIDPGLVAEKILTSLYSQYILIAIPLFVFTAKIMNVGTITDRLFNFTKALLWKLPGALGHVNILASLIFSGMTGSAVADVSGLGIMEINAMRKEKYDDGFSCSITAASATIGPIFPPSIPMIQYALVSGASVGGLFLGGMIPGIIMGLALMIYVYFIAKKRNYPMGIKYSIKKLFLIFFDAFPAILTPIILLSGIYSGIMTPTEAAAVAAFYALLVSSIIYRCINLKKLREILIDTVKTTGSIGLLIATAYALNYVIGREHIASIFAHYILNFTDNKYLFLFMINIVFLCLGMFINVSTIILVFVPIILPLVKIFDINLVHFGVVIVMNSMIGLITPPYGVILFIISRISDTSFVSIIKELIPLIFVLILVLMLCTYFPIVVTLIPNMLN
jgi:tripartite ATP-independent transporter DctM subunit